ncbi:ADP-ribosylation factor-like protein 4D [Porphyridium purpureum]|uniref:ADP-ribosylation factor-like protein 4D n=1 Tax=Porphyridium purpureum TaxID=35688 RepID=A0A5J4YQQ0_PORPP|nr:ADP-ribosylation factor-like protein 4D [Porphyridium purpureum]|eukprot:POR3755..scf236_6
MSFLKKLGRKLGAGSPGHAPQMTVLCVGIDGAGTSTLIRAMAGTSHSPAAARQRKAGETAADADRSEQAYAKKIQAQHTVGVEEHAVFIDSHEIAAQFRTSSSTSPSAAAAPDGSVCARAFAAGLNLRVFNVAGSEGSRALWRTYYDSADGVMYIVDAADPDRFLEAKEELEKLLFRSDNIMGKAVASVKVPLLVLANKSDLQGAMSAEQLEVKLKTHLFPLDAVHVGSCSAAEQKDIRVNLMWLVEHMLRAAK